MHIYRNNFPSEQICRHIAISLSVLADHMELQPHLFRVQMDHSAVLPHSTVRKMRDDFCEASRNPSRHTTSGPQPFFYEEERHTLATALHALNEYRENVGESLLAMDMIPLLGRLPESMLSHQEIESLANLTSDRLASIQAPARHQPSPYKGVVINGDSHPGPSGSRDTDSETNEPGDWQAANQEFVR